MTATPSDIVTTRLWLALALERVAGWRDAKAEQYPDDLRNQRSANALRSAAQYLRAMPRASRNLELFTELLIAARDSGFNFTNAPQLPGNEAQRVAARYYFEDAAEPADENSHEELIRDVYRASLRDLREIGAAKTSPLAIHLASNQPVPTDPVVAALKGIDDSLRAATSDGRLSRVQQLLEVSRVLVRLDEQARTEADSEGRFPQLLQPTRMPLLRKELRVSLTALSAFGGPELPTAEKLINEPPQFRDATVSAVLSALEEVDRALGAERVRVNAWLVPGNGGGEVTQIRDLVVDDVSREITAVGRRWRPRGTTTTTRDGREEEVWHQYDEVV